MRLREEKPCFSYNYPAVRGSCDKAISTPWPSSKGLVNQTDPTFVARVFKLNVRALIEILSKHGGRAAAYMGSRVSIPRRTSCPHVDNLTICGKATHTQADMHELVSAEWKRPALQPKLYAAVCKHMRPEAFGPPTASIHAQTQARKCAAEAAP